MSVTHYSLEGKTAVVQMDDGKANALSDAMITELLESLGRAEQEASAIVLAGRQERFCAGFDLKVMMSGPDAAKGLLTRGAELLMRLYGTPLPLVIACTGHALAGGALVLLTGDVRLGAEGAFRIGLNEVSIGLPVPVLAMELARARIAPTELAHVTLGGRIHAPDEAARVGFLDRLVSAADVLAKAKEEASKLGALSRFAYAGTKKRLRGATIHHITSTLDEDMRSIAAGS
jgi:enoyl-CoA hydratase